MKKLVVTLLIAPTLWLNAVAQTPPTADEILNKYLKAIGGKRALSKVKDLTYQASAQWNGNPVQVLSKKTAPDKYCTEINANGQILYKETVNGSNIVVGTPGSSRPIEGPKAQILQMASLLVPELHFAKLGVKSSFAGTEPVNGRSTYKLTHATADGTYTWSSNYDTETGLKVQEIIPQLTGIVEVREYTDYREVNGMKCPFTITATAQSPNYRMIITLQNLEVNKGLSDSEFAVQ